MAVRKPLELWGRVFPDATSDSDLERYRDILESNPRDVQRIFRQRCAGQPVDDKSDFVDNMNFMRKIGIMHSFDLNDVPNEEIREAYFQEPEDEAEDFKMMYELIALIRRLASPAQLLAAIQELTIENPSAVDPLFHIFDSICDVIQDLYLYDGRSFHKTQFHVLWYDLLGKNISGEPSETTKSFAEELHEFSQRKRSYPETCKSLEEPHPGTGWNLATLFLAAHKFLEYVNATELDENVFYPFVFKTSESTSSSAAKPHFPDAVWNERFSDTRSSVDAVSWSRFFATMCPQISDAHPMCALKVVSGRIHVALVGRRTMDEYGLSYRDKRIKDLNTSIGDVVFCVWKVNGYARVYICFGKTRLRVRSTEDLERIVAMRCDGAALPVTNRVERMEDPYADSYRKALHGWMMGDDASGPA